MRFRPHKIWNLFVLGLFCLSAFFCIGSFVQIRAYNKLQKKTRCLQLTPLVSRVEKKGYRLEGVYFFHLEGKEYEQKQKLANHYFKNREQANQFYLEQKEAMQWVWVDPKQPSCSQLVKIFPLKKLLYSAFIVVISLYFWFLGKYISLKKREE